MYKCKKCGQEFEGNFCPDCGAKKEEARKCPNCGAEASGKFCSNCGHAMNAPETAVEKETALNAESAEENVVSEESAKDGEADEEKMYAAAADESAEETESSADDSDIATEKAEESAVMVGNAEEKAAESSSASAAPAKKADAPSSLKRTYKIMPAVASGVFLLYAVVMFLTFLGAVATAVLIFKSDDVYTVAKLTADDYSDFQPYVSEVCQALIAFGSISLIFGVLALAFNLYPPLRSLKIKLKTFKLRVSRIFDYACLVLCFVMFLLGCILCGGATDDILRPGPAPGITVAFSLIFGIAIGVMTFMRQIINKLYPNVKEELEQERASNIAALEQPQKPVKPVNPVAMPEEPMAEYPVKEPVGDKERMKCTWLIRGIDICFYMLFGVFTLFIVPIVFIVKTFKKRQNFCLIARKTIPIVTIVLSLIATIGFAVVGDMFSYSGHLGVLKYINAIDKGTVKSQETFMTYYAYDKDIYKGMDISRMPEIPRTPAHSIYALRRRYRKIDHATMYYYYIGNFGYSSDNPAYLNGSPENPEFSWQDMGDFNSAVSAIRENFANKELYLQYVDGFDCDAMKKLRSLSDEVVGVADYVMSGDHLLSALTNYPDCFETLDYSDIAANGGRASFRYSQGTDSFLVGSQSEWQSCIELFENYRIALTDSYDRFGFQFMSRTQWESMVADHGFMMYATCDGIGYKVWNYKIKLAKEEMLLDYAQALLPTFCFLFMALYILIFCASLVLFIFASRKAKAIFATTQYKKDPQYAEICAEFEGRKQEIMEEYKAKKAEYDAAHKQFVNEMTKYVLAYVGYLIDCGYYNEGVQRKR